MKTIGLSLVYFITGLLFITIQQSSFYTGLILKALIIPVLILLFIVNIRKEYNTSDIMIFSGLIFSWAGDVVLELSGRHGDLFIAGLLCFLLAHIMYSVVFFGTPGKNALFGSRAYLVIPVLVFGMGLIYYLYDDLSGMRVPVIIYAIVILLMLAGAINRIEKVNRQSYFLVLTGAILFVISDSAIAINKFSFHFENSGIVIMSTYIAAQYLIVTGYIKQSKPLN